LVSRLAEQRIRVGKEITKTAVHGIIHASGNDDEHDSSVIIDYDMLTEYY
jgi:ssRNA-specific RNase YbeY (16S rRNA maturation enzyme)